MASSENPVDINNANVEELKLIPNIGEKRALIIVRLREEKGVLSAEDLKTLTTIPSTIWDPLVSEGVIRFGERDTPSEKSHSSIGDAMHQIAKLQSEIVRLTKDNERKDIQIVQSEKDITDKQQQIDYLENALRSEHEEQMHNLQQKFQSELENTKEYYENTISKTLKSKDKELAVMEQKLLDQDSRWVSKIQHLESKIKQLEDDKISREVDKLAPQGVYRKPSFVNLDTNEPKGPSPPKMSTFDGKSDWRPFFTQFTHIASRYKWSDEQKLDKLIESLRDKALKYFSSRPSSDQRSFKKLSTKMNERFGKKDLPHIIRRQLQDVKQSPEESVEEFADKVLEMTTDGYPDTPEDCRQTVAIDAFLRGCTNKQAALIAMDKNPPTLDIATQYIKSAITNQNLILGTKKSEVRRVKFESSESESEEDEEKVNKVRAIYNSKQTSTQQTEQTNVSRLESRVQRLEDDTREIKTNIQDILKILKTPSQKNNYRPNSRESARVRSPSSSPSRKTCFKCDQEGHFANNCPNRRNRSPSPRPQSPLNFNRLEM
jgi:hypothetical protein